MHRVVRAVLVWVMVIAMPLQALAASTMRFCGPSHARMMQGLVAAASVSAPHHHAHQAMQGAVAAEHGSHAHGGPAHATNADAAQAAAADAGASSPHAGKFSCSACAACCSLLALPAGAALPAAIGPALPPQPSLAPPIASHQPDRLDRPPRTRPA